MQIELKRNQSILDWLINEMIKEAHRLMSEEFGYIFNNTTTKVVIKVNDDPELIFEDCIQKENLLTKEKIYQNIMKYKNENAGTSMYVENLGCFQYGRYQLPTVNLVFYKPGVTKVLIPFLYDFEYFVDYMKLSVRHEIGHIIELINCVGKSFQEMRSRYIDIVNAKEAHFSKWNNILKGDSIERMVEYYNMPQERIANMYAGVDPNELIEYNERLVNGVGMGVILNIDAVVGRPNIQQTVYQQQEPPRFY